jgi:putative SOS response-associated peptidase YedK
MPVILDEESIALWLDPATSQPESLQPVLVPSPNDQLQVRAVSTRVNSYKNDDSSLISEVPVSHPEAVDGQLGLFDNSSD